jgi:D-glycero-alpha-D-manno-heptose-7-phosphate kinase
MIICRTPLRISLFGGGTDFEEWFSKNDGVVISMAINQYCYATLREIPDIHPFKYRLRYFKNEFTKSINQIRHKSIKAVLKNFDKRKNSLELIHSADLPALSGLGSSSAFTASLINLIYANNQEQISKKELAYKSVYIEKKILKESVGYQDQFASSFGGFNIINFSKKKVSVNSINISQDKIKNLLDNMVLYFTGLQRHSQVIEKNKIENLDKNEDFLKGIYSNAIQAKNILYSKKKLFLPEIGSLLYKSWELKKKLSPKVSNKKIDKLINFGLNNGACGAKLLGAGGGGFILYLTNNQTQKKQLIEKLSKFKIVNFKIDELGSQILYRN